MDQFSIRNLFTINKPEVGKTIVIDSIKNRHRRWGEYLAKRLPFQLPHPLPGLNKIEMVPEPLEVTFSLLPYADLRRFP